MAIWTRGGRRGDAMTRNSFGARSLDVSKVRTGLFVLVVDDDESNRLVAEAALELFRCRSESVTGGALALQAVCTTHFDLILMDYHMPHMDGLEVTRAIRAWEAENGQTQVPIIGLTGSTMNSEQMSCVVAGMNGVLTKPFQFEHLRDALIKWCSQPNQ